MRVHSLTGASYGKNESVALAPVDAADSRYWRGEFYTKESSGAGVLKERGGPRAAHSFSFRAGKFSAVWVDQAGNEKLDEVKKRTAEWAKSAGSASPAVLKKQPAEPSPSMARKLIRRISSDGVDKSGGH